MDNGYDTNHSRQCKPFKGYFKEFEMGSELEIIQKLFYFELDLEN